MNQSSIPHIFPVAILLSLLAASAAGDDLFRDRVAPLLERRCLACHNAREQKGQFSVESREEFFASGFVVAGNPEDSSLLSAVVSSSAKILPAMPRDGAPLTDDEVGLLRQWILAGASWPDGITLQEPVVDNFEWWSLRPVTVADLPDFASDADRQWIRTPIDAFVLSALHEKKLTPSPEADRRTLIRRATFDLTGLPPTPEELDAFVKDESPTAFEAVVDRLLASPGYGERWARHWLDVVRYADTCGYDKDKLRPNAWPYRDYVIRAFNEDKPYGRFVEEQLAGDRLFPNQPDGILGLGFIAAGPWDFIGHVEVPESKTDGKVARNLDRDDMVAGALNTFCSVTIQCARCHNHKFDPFTQQHYYSLQSVFAAVDRAERPYDTDAKIESRRAELIVQRDMTQSKLAELDAAIRSDGGSVLSVLEQQIEQLKPRAEVAAKRTEYGYHSEIVATADVEKWVEVDLGQDHAISEIVLNPCHDEFGGIGAGFGFPVRFRVEAVAELSRGAANTGDATATILWDQTHADYSNPGLMPVTVSVPVTARFVRITATRLAPRQNDFIFALAELQVVDRNGTNLARGRTVQTLDSIEAPERWRKSNLTDGIWPVPVDEVAARQLAEASRQKAELLQRLETTERQASRQSLHEQAKAAAQELAGLPQGKMLYAAATQFPVQGNFRPTLGTPRIVRLLHRGNETQPRDEVQPGTIPLSATDAWQFELPAGHHESDRRAALAKWVTRADHPLTWRSIVNRVWQYHYGRGIVESANDFGRMGQQPSHPELLDWLANDFQKHGQSLKHLHRMIMTSSTYRQSTASNAAAEAIDGDNRLLWRMNRRRLEAEEIRDSILAVTGKLNLEMGGPGFYLFELEKPEHSPHYEYSKFNPEETSSHRRSIYRFIVRSQPDPFMTTLDCADSSQSTPRRHETQTALQALSLLNNPFNLAMARHFSARLQADANTPEEQIDRAFLLLTGRQPDAGERSLMVEYAAQHGMPALCRLLFNLSEFVFVD